MIKAIFILFLVLPFSLQAQIISSWEVESEQFLFRLKNIEFFINRFNNENDSIPSKVDQKDSVAFVKFVQDRTGSLVSLFDQVRIKNKTEKDFRERGARFIQSVNDPSRQQYLHFADSSWFAETKVSCTYLNKPAELVCVLQINRIPTGGFEWSLLSMKLRSLNLVDNFNKDKIILPPSAHGTDFISLSQLLKNEEFIRTETANSGKAILSLINDKKLVTGSVNFIRYHFLQLEDWLITSEYINRSSRNSGWLIKDLNEMDSEAKVDYVKKLISQ